MIQLGDECIKGKVNKYFYNINILVTRPDVINNGITMQSYTQSEEEYQFLLFIYQLENSSMHFIARYFMQKLMYMPTCGMMLILQIN